MNGRIEMSPTGEDLRDALKDEAAFDPISTFSPPPGALWVVPDVEEPPC